MNDNGQGAPDAKKIVEDKAIEWFVKMRGEDAQALKSEFDAWILESPDHAAAYRWAEMHFGASESLKNTSPVPEKRARPRRWGMVAAAAVVAIGMATALRPVWEPRLDIHGEAFAQEPLETRHGEIRTYRLPDGSNVTLDSDSRLEVAMSEAERRVKLREGKARFAVTADPRPFVVEAGAGTVRADEAVFDVGYGYDRQVEVNLVSGNAEMSSSVRPATYTIPGRRLLPGETLRYPVADFRPQLAQDNGTDRKDWPSGWVEYRSIALSDLAAEANRYASSPIIIDDPELGTLKASGRFKLTDTGQFVSRIAEVFDLAVSRKADGIHLRRK